VVTTRRQARQLGQAALRHQAEAHHAQLRALQAKVNPHFFFNSLNSLRGLVFENQEAAARMIDQIATLMRYSLGSGERHTVPLADEMSAVRAYLAIEQIRFEARLRVDIDIPAALGDLPIPPMTLQTLVENAVKYGVEPNPLGSEVRIHARRDGTAVELSVLNQGSIRERPGSTRIGLDNVAQRLALALPGPSRLNLSEADGWVTACIRIEGAP
jgi:LytS/YehU family sensor histidine kinase